MRTFYCIFKNSSYDVSSIRKSINFKFANKKMQKDIIQSKKLKENVKYVTTDLLKISREVNKSTEFKKIPSVKRQLNSEREYVYGIHPVSLALKAKLRNISCLFCKSGSENKRKMQEILSLADEGHIPIKIVENDWFTKYIGKEVHQGVCLDASLLHSPIFDLNIENIDLENWLVTNQFFCKKDNAPILWLYLDKVYDPMNFGNIIRTAYFLGVSQIFTGTKYNCPITNVVSKASSGIAELFPIVKLAHIEESLNSLKSKGWSIVSAMPPSHPGVVSLSECTPHQKTLLIVGSEHEGISEQLQISSDFFVTINTPEVRMTEESLNVSVATGILIHSLLSKMKKVS